MAALYRRILVPLDGSPEAEAVLPYAGMMARRFGATLELVRACAPTRARLATAAASVVPVVGRIVDTGASIVADRAEAETYLAKADARLRCAGLKAEHLRLEGAPGESIVAEAERSGADMIAMTTHGRGGLDRLVHGSVASYVCQHATCPVLVVRPDTATPAS